MFCHLEDLDFSDDLAILSTNRSNLQEKTTRLETYAKQTGLHINTAKTQVMYVNATPTAPITANGDLLEFVDEFTYLGSFISKDNGAQKDIKSRLGILITIDFEKAFDSVNHSFLTKTLEAFNFGPSFIRWASSFNCNLMSCIMNNGFSTEYFPISRGVRQGDPYLFLMVLEIFVIHVRENNCRY